MNQTKNILKIIIISAINIALSYGLFAQHPQYSVQLIVNLVPPYSINTVDYVSGDNEKLTVLLTNTDLAKPYLTIRLRMQVKCNNQVILQSKPYGNYPPIQLQSGIPTKISLHDLAPYFNTDNLDIQGMDVQRFLRSKTLPEGMYQFCFEAIEYYTGQVVGRSSCAMAPLLLAEPPLLNLPFNNKVLFSREPQNIIFQWTPRHLSVPSLAFNSEYVFSLHELYDNGLSVEAAFNNTPALYEEVLKPSTLLYGPEKPLLMEGKRYAWRVQARRDIPGEESLIRNNGYSQIYGFTYQSACQPPENVQATPTHNKAAITWNPNPIMHAENAEGNYMVEYREKTMDNAGADNYSGQASWYNTPGDNYRATLYNLKPGKTYQYRVAMRCPLTNGYAYSDVRELVTEKQPVNPENLSCGKLIPKQDITNRQSLPQLSAGETFYAADFPVTVKEVTQNGENYTGKGWVTIPVLEYGLFKAVAEFDNIKINTDRQLIAGFVKTTYDETGKNIYNADRLITGGGNEGIIVTGKSAEPDKVLDFVIPDVQSIKITPFVNTPQQNNTPDKTNASGTTHLKIEVKGKNGEKETFVIPNDNAVIKDSAGNVYEVKKNEAGNYEAKKVGNVQVSEDESISSSKDQEYLYIMEDGKYDMYYNGSTLNFMKDNKKVKLKILYFKERFHGYANAVFKKECDKQKEKLKNDQNALNKLPDRIGMAKEADKQIKEDKFKISYKGNSITAKEITIDLRESGSYELKVDAREALNSACVYNTKANPEKEEEKIISGNEIDRNNFKVKINILKSGTLYFEAKDEAYYKDYGFDDAKNLILQTAGDYEEIDIPAGKYYVPWLGVETNKQVEVKTAYLSPNPMADSIIVFKCNNSNVYMNDKISLFVVSTQEININPLKVKIKEYTEKPVYVDAYAVDKLSKSENWVGRLKIENRELPKQDKIIQIIRVRRGGEKEYPIFTKEQKTKLIHTLNEYYSQAFIKFKEDPDKYDDELAISKPINKKIESVKGDIYNKISDNRKKSSTYYLFLCNKGDEDDFNGQGGMNANYALVYKENLEGFATTPHELGHNLGLEHVFENKYNDPEFVKMTGKNGRSRVLPQYSTLNIMDYLSFPAVDNRKHFFWYQIEYLKKHAQKQTK